MIKCFFVKNSDVFGAGLAIVCPPLLNISIPKCAMTWCLSYRCITCSFSTGTIMCPAPMKEIGQKGTVKLCRVPPAGVASAERSKLYRTEAITSGSSYHRM